MANRIPKSYQEQIDAGDIITETMKPQLDIEALEERINTLEELLVIVLCDANNKEALDAIHKYVSKNSHRYPHFHGFGF